MAVWRDNKIEDLAKQLTYSPAEKRLEQITAASVLIDEIEPAKAYPWEFILYRLTGYRPKEPVPHAVAGKFLRADLSTFIEFLSDTLAIRADQQGETVLTLEEVTKQFAVSTKTIQRWRKQGLIAQRYIFADGRRRLGFLKTSVEKFSTSNADRVANAATFRQLSDEEKAQIITWARRLAKKCQCCMKDISRRIARHTGRSPETIRYTIRKHDQDHPEQAIFPSADESIRELDTQIISACFANGVSLDCLAKRYCQSRASIYRVVTRERARKLKRTTVEFMPNPLFDHPDADAIILDVLRRESHARAAETLPKPRDLYSARLPKDLPAYLAGAFLDPPMPAELETDLARRMNYLKCKAARLIAAIDFPTVRPADLDAIESLLARANEIKNQLVQANLRVAIHVARKHQRPGLELIELISDATIWLMRAVEKFDFARGNRLSTYASWAIMKNFARDRSEQLTRRDKRFVTGQDEVLSQVGERPEPAVADQLDASAEKRDLMDVIAQLPARQRDLVLAHYGLDETRPPMSLSELGAEMGLSKARVRQLEARALEKLRQLLEQKRTARLTPTPE